MKVQNLYDKVKSGELSKQEFLMEIHRDSRFSSIVVTTNSYDDVISILKNKSIISDNPNPSDSPIKNFDIIGSIKFLKESSEKSLNEGMVQKLKGGKGDKLTPDDVNYYEFQKGWRHELEHTDDVDKAKEIALDHLAEDPIYYTRLDMVEFQAKKKNRADLPTEVKRGEASKDPHNQMEKVKKISTSRSGEQKEEKVEDHKKNVGNKKEKPKKVKVKTMKGGSGKMEVKELNEAEEKPSDSWYEGPAKYILKYTTKKEPNIIKSSIVTIDDLDKFKKDIVSKINVKEVKKQEEFKGGEYAKTKIVKIVIPDLTKGQKKGDIFGFTEKRIQDHIAKFGEGSLEFIIDKSAPIKKQEEPKPTPETKPETKIIKNPVTGRIESVPVNLGIKRVPFEPSKTSTTFHGDYQIVDIKNKKAIAGLNDIKLAREAVKRLGSNYEVWQTMKVKSNNMEPADIVKDSMLYDFLKKYTYVRPKIKNDPGKYQIVDVKDKKSVIGVLDKVLADKVLLKFGPHYELWPITRVETENIIPAEDTAISENEIYDAIVKYARFRSANIKNSLNENLKKLFKKKLKEYLYNILPTGPNVKQEELRRLLHNYQWTSPENDYQKINKQQLLQKIQTLVNDLGDVGKDIVSQETPDWGDQGDQVVNEDHLHTDADKIDFILATPGYKGNREELQKLDSATLDKAYKNAEKLIAQRKAASQNPLSGYKFKDVDLGSIKK